MIPTIEVKCQDDALKQKRRLAADKVIAHFGKLPDRRLLCFFDDEDCQAFKALGEENRGFYSPVKRGDPYWAYRPMYVNQLILVPDPVTYVLKQMFDDVIYLHGSTCADETGLIMTFAHELQHFVQHGSNTKLWAENVLIPNLPVTIINSLQLHWFDIPTEREARVIAKRTAEILCGQGAVRQYIARKLAEATKPQDIADWRFIQTLDAEKDSTELAQATRLIFQRLRSYRPELEKILEEFKDDPDFKDIDLAT